MSAADTGSLYFEGAPPALRDTMWRVGAGVRPTEFVQAVVEAFRTVEVISEDAVEARFRASRPFRDFTALLRETPLSAARVLAIGCGRGLAGRGSSYAAAVIRETCAPGAIAELDCLDLTPDTLPQARAPYQLVVTHSLLHFLHDLKPIGRLLLQMIAPGGRYIMANEPNARFWTNPECVRGMQEAGAWEGRRKHLRKYIDPARYWSRLRRLAFGEQRDSIGEMNALLRDRLGLTGELTAKEIVRIVDPHLPDGRPGEFPLGCEGLDWSQLESGPLFGLRLEAVRTSGYVMRENPDRIPERWRATDEKLASLYPLDGCSFSAQWSRAANLL